MFPTLFSSREASSADTTKREPRRVILRLRVAEFETYEAEIYDEFIKAIKAYLRFANIAPEEIDEQKHFPHIEPLQAPELRQTSFHIILDMEKDQTVDLSTLPYMIYYVRREINGDL